MSMIESYEQTMSLEQVGAARSRERRQPALLLAGVTALTLFFVPQILQALPALGGMQVVKLTALAVALLFLSSRELIESRVRLREVPAVKCIVGMLALGLITVPLSVWPAGSFNFATDVYAKNIVFVYLLVQAARRERDFRVIVTAVALGASALVAAMLTGVGQLITYKQEPGRVAIGGTYDPNDLALLFVIAIPFAFFMLKSSRPVVRLLLIGSIVLMLIGMVKTGSRGGFLGLLVISLLIFLRVSKQARKYALVVALLGASLAALAAPKSYWTRIQTIYNYQGDYNLTEEGGRIKVWEAGMKMVAANPITGVGIACFQFEHAKVTGSKLQIAPHNSFLQAAAELGVPGLILFLSIIVISIRGVRRVRRGAQEGGAGAQFLWLAAAAEISFIGFLVSGSFLSHAYSPIFCFLTGVCAAVRARYKVIQQGEETPEEEIEYA